MSSKIFVFSFIISFFILSIFYFICSLKKIIRELDGNLSESEIEEIHIKNLIYASSYFIMAIGIFILYFL